jgi:hypothetical protein
MSDTTNSADLIDVRDVIDRFEELEDARRDEDEAQEFTELSALLEELKGCGGDHQWRGDWYPVTLIHDCYFEKYAQELASDIYGKEIDKAQWPFDCIDWEKAASDLQGDYSTVDYDGVTYWYR